MCFAKRELADPELKFWVSVKSSRDGCWEWQGRLNCDGYGEFYVQHDRAAKAIKWLAHRFSWFLHFGDIPRGMGVLHKCDNRPCIRPDHLFIGSRSVNALDMVAKNRHVKGERVGASKVTAEQVIDLRREFVALPRVGSKCAPNTVMALAARFGISQSTLYTIVNRKQWVHVDDPTESALAAVAARLSVSS